MFGEQAFRTWGHILAGAALFAGLFAGAALAAGPVLQGVAEPLPARRIVALALLAFVGYVGAARLGAPS